MIISLFFVKIDA